MMERAAERRVQRILAAALQTALVSPAGQTDAMSIPISHLAIIRS
jgi:hypothetical protein